MARKIIEIGPGLRPMHHRVCGDFRSCGDFKLMEGESYTALDLAGFVFKNGIWRDIKRIYEDRIEMIVGNREDMNFADLEFDEVICLSTIPKYIQGLNRVLRPGGILVYGLSEAALISNTVLEILKEMRYEVYDQINYEVCSSGSYQRIIKYMVLKILKL